WKAVVTCFASSLTLEPPARGKCSRSISAPAELRRHRDARPGFLELNCRYLFPIASLSHPRIAFGGAFLNPVHSLFDRRGTAGGSRNASCGACHCRRRCPDP